MTKLQYYILVLICVSCLGGKPENTSIEIPNLFENYLRSFEKQPLPFSLDRKAVFEMMNNESQYSEIKDDFKIFIPIELKNNFPNSTFRSQYLFPSHNSIIVALIFQDYINEYEVRIVKNHVVSYDAKGTVIDYVELAGVATDAWEAFGEITNDYVVVRKLYQFRINNDVEMAKFFLLVETLYEYSITNFGMIENTKETERIGYFAGDWKGYSFLKPLNE